MTSMTRCLKRNSLSLILLTALLVLAHACTKMDKTLGENFIPNDQQLQVELLDATRFCSMRTVKIDSISTANFSYGMLGIHEEPRLGRTVAGFATTFIPREYGYDFGDTVHGFDSVYLQLAFAAPYGYGLDKSQMEIEVYELTATLTDSAFYGVEDYNASTKLIDGMIGAKVSVDGSITTLNYDSTWAYIKLDASLLPKLWSNMSSADTFKAAFKGLYVTVKDNGGGCMKYVDIVNTSSSSPASALIAMYHTDDTTTQAFTYHVYSSSSLNTPRFNYIRHTSYNDDKISQLDNGMLYMQGLAGVVTELQFHQDSIQSWIDEKNVARNGIAVNRAELILPVEDSTNYTYLDNLYSTTMSAMQRLEGGGYATTFDASSYNVTAFGGSLNRSMMQYALGITNTFNDALLRKSTTPVLLTPSNYANTASSIFISNRAGRKPQLKIWYSEVK